MRHGIPVVEGYRTGDQVVLTSLEHGLVNKRGIVTGCRADGLIRVRIEFRTWTDQVSPSASLAVPLATMLPIGEWKAGVRSCLTCGRRHQPGSSGIVYCRPCWFSAMEQDERCLT